jgi:hypothetical protein
VSYSRICLVRIQPGTVQISNLGRIGRETRIKRPNVIEKQNYGCEIATSFSNLYPDSLKQPIRELLREYVDARIKYYAAADDELKISQTLQESDSLATRIWLIASQYSFSTEGRVASTLMLTALNNMFDSASTRDDERIARVPPVILWIILFFLLMSGFYLGFKKKGMRSNSIVVLLWSLAVTLTLYMLLELDRPKRGIINLDHIQKKMELLKMQLQATE